MWKAKSEINRNRMRRSHKMYEQLKIITLSYSSFIHLDLYFVENIGSIYKI